MPELVDWMEDAVALSLRAVQSRSGGPFGAVIVRDDQLIAGGHNQVIAQGDPTAHAEVQAIRAACAKLGDHRLERCVLFTSCEPCPMCLGAIYWARIERVYYANTRSEAAAIGFDDAFIYEDITREFSDRRVAMHRLTTASAARAMAEWSALHDRTPY